jgi:hypothetical protein
MYFFRGDEELDTLIKATIAGGGVIPHIHKSLIGETLLTLTPLNQLPSVAREKKCYAFNRRYFEEIFFSLSLFFLSLSFIIIFLK